MEKKEVKDCTECEESREYDETNTLICNNNCKDSEGKKECPNCGTILHECGTNPERILFLCNNCGYKIIQNERQPEPTCQGCIHNEEFTGICRNKEGICVDHNKYKPIVKASGGEKELGFTMSSKTCTICKKVLSLDFFNKDKRGKYGVSSRCKECHKEYMINYRKANRDRLREYETNRSKKKEPQRKRWKDKKVKDNPLQMTYNSIHQYIRRHKIKPKYCMICNEKKSLQLASIDHTYTKNPDDYLWVCQDCHLIFDRNREVLIIE